MKNIAKRVAAGLIAALLLATTGCAAGGSSKQQDFQPSLDTEKEVQFNVIGYFENFEALDQVMNDFSAYYPNATFVYQRVRDNDEVAYLEANTDVDLFMTSGDLLHRQGAALPQYCVDLSEENIDLSAIAPEMLRAHSVDGRQLSVPIGQNIRGLVVNTTLLKKEGLAVPRNLPEFLNALSVLKAKGYTPIQGPTSKVYAGVTSGMIFSGLCQGQPLREALKKGDMDAAEQAVLPAMELMDTLVKSGYTDPALNAAYPDDNYDGSILRFFEGDVPFWVCNTEKVSGMKKRESKSETFKKQPFSYGFIYAPVGEAGQYIYREPWFGFAANKIGKNADYAVEFLRFLATQAESNRIADVKGVPSAAEDGTSSAIYTKVLDETLTANSCVNQGEVTPAMVSKWYSCITQYALGKYASAHEAAQDFLGACSAEIK